jgi:hypothetical protein
MLASRVAQLSVESGGGTRRMLLRRGLWLEYATLAWNVAGVVVLVSAAVATGSWRSPGLGWTR